MARKIVKIEKSVLKNLGLNYFDIISESVDIPGLDRETFKQNLMNRLKGPGKFIYVDASHSNSKEDGDSQGSGFGLQVQYLFFKFCQFCIRQFNILFCRKSKVQH